jgi:three-Cys-motif partner protein
VESTDRDTAFFDSGFDDVTLKKLEVYAGYLQEWLPVPLSGQMHVSRAVVYDLFCGPGSDSNNVDGSPLIARNIVLRNADTIRNSQVRLELVFNDYHADHVETLRSKLGSTISAEDGTVLANVSYHAEPFEDLLPDLIDEMNRRTGSFLFIDQFGATSVDENVFRMLHSLKTTDVLFFVSSVWFRRFAGRPEAADWGVTKDDVMNIQYNHVHRFVTEHFRSLVGSDYFLAPFSLKKGSNIYGLVFASHNHLGLKKFLEVAWKEDPHSGEANFDMYREGVGKAGQLVIFEARKITEFQDDLERRILARQFRTDRDIYIHMLQSGFINKHARPVVSRLASRRGGVIEFQSEGIRKQPRLSPQSVKEPRELIFL